MKRIMKIKIILALFISTLCNAQITLNDMKLFLNNNIDYYETFALNNGYVFKEIIKKDEFDGVAFAKGIGKDTKHLVLYSSYSEYGKMAFFYQTSKESDYLLIKKQLLEQEFKLIDTYDYEGNLIKEYKNKLYKITLKTGRMSESWGIIEFYTAILEFNK
jgi:hypothetical protein